MKENLLRNKSVGGGGGKYTEIALEIHFQETERVLIMQLSLQLSRFDKVITLYNVCTVLWVLSTFGGVQYRVGYHKYHRRYLEYRGGVQYCGGYHGKCGDILSTVGVFSTVGENLLLFEYPTVLMIPHGTQISKDGIPDDTHDMPHIHHDAPQYSR